MKVRAIHEVIVQAVSEADAATLRMVIGAVLGMCVSEREAAEQARRTAAECADTGDTIRQAVLKGQAYGRSTAAERIEDEIIVALDLEAKCEAATEGLPDDRPAVLSALGEGGLSAPVIYTDPHKTVQVPPRPRTRGLGGPDRARTRAVIDCLFCDPARSRILARSGGWYVRFDNYPATKGHVEVVPFKHVGSWFSLSPVEQLEAFSLLAEAADVIASMRQVDDWNIFINDGPAAGRTIHHLHVHLVPRQSGDQDDPRGGCRRGLPNGDVDAWDAPIAPVQAPRRDAQ